MSSSLLASSSNNSTPSSDPVQSSLSSMFIFDSIKRNDFEQVKLFVQQDPSLLHMIDENNNLPVHLACRCNHEKIALFILDSLSTQLSTQQLIEMIQRENNEKQSPITLANPKLRGMIKASIEISKMKKLLIEKYENKRMTNMNNTSFNNNNTSNNTTTTASVLNE